MGEDTLGVHLEAIVKAVGADMDLIQIGVMVVDREAVGSNDLLMVRTGGTIQEAISEIDLRVAAVQPEAVVVVI